MDSVMGPAGASQGQMHLPAVSPVRCSGKQPFLAQAFYRLGNVAFGKRPQFGHVCRSVKTGIIFQKCNNGGFHLCKAILFTDALEHSHGFADAPHGLQIFGCLKHRRILLSANSSKSKVQKRTIYNGIIAEKCKMSR